MMETFIRFKFLLPTSRLPLQGLEFDLRQMMPLWIQMECSGLI